MYDCVVERCPELISLHSLQFESTTLFLYMHTYSVAISITNKNNKESEKKTRG